MSTSTLLPRPEGYRLVLIAPSVTEAAQVFDSARHDPEGHRTVLDAIQRTRASVYLADGAIGMERVQAGRYVSALDGRSWHVAVMNGDDVVEGCIRFTFYPNCVSVKELGIYDAGVFTDDVSGNEAQKRVEQFVSDTYRDGLVFGEVGGWAVTGQRRHARKSVVLAVMSWVLFRRFGGGRAISMATIRHGAADILVKVGALRAEHILASYFDRSFNCDMRLLGFDSRRLHCDWGAAVEELDRQSASGPVLCASVLDHSARGASSGSDPASISEVGCCRKEMSVRRSAPA